MFVLSWLKKKEEVRGEQVGSQSDISAGRKHSELTPYVVEQTGGGRHSVISILGASNGLSLLTKDDDHLASVVVTGQCFESQDPERKDINIYIQFTRWLRNSRVGI